MGYSLWCTGASTEAGLARRVGHLEDQLHPLQEELVAQGEELDALGDQLLGNQMELAAFKSDLKADMRVVGAKLVDALGKAEVERAVLRQAHRAQSECKYQSVLQAVDISCCDNGILAFGHDTDLLNRLQDMCRYQVAAAVEGVVQLQQLQLSAADQPQLVASLVADLASYKEASEATMAALQVKEG